MFTCCACLAHVKLRLVALTPNAPGVMQTMIVPRGAKGEVLCGSLKLLCPLLEVCRSSTDLHGESDLIVTAIGAMITVFQKSSLVDSTSEMVNDALGCLHHLTTFPEGRQQALQLLTVDKIEALQKAALTWLEDDFQPANHWAIAAGKATVLPP